MIDGSTTCVRCGAVAPPGAGFCGACGARLVTAAATETRKTVTTVFCDVAGSTALGEQVDAEVLHATMERYFGVVGDVLAHHGGTVEKFVGDAVMAVFGIPVTHEDDALRACRAALDIVAAVERLGLTVRVGAETGEVLVGDPSRGSSFASGTSVNVAARLEQAADPGQVLIGPACHRLVRDHAELGTPAALDLKGLGGPVTAHRLLAVRDTRESEGRASTPLVGRTRELALLHQAFERARSDRTCQLATVLGVAGMGKTRVTTEFLDQLAGRATVLRGRCVSYGEGVTYWPIVEAVRQAAGLDGSEPQDLARRRLRELLGDAPDASEVVTLVGPTAGLGGAPADPADTAWAVRRLLAAVARHRPLVLVVEDLHWAETGLVRLLDEICTWLRDAPVLVLVNARPEFLDDHASWGAGRVNGVTALLEPLAGDEIGRLTTQVLGGLLPDGLAERVRSTAGGNPLFVQHVVAMLVEDGVLTQSRSGWQVAGDVDRVVVPPTVSALIAARLDRLTPDEHAVIGVAAVIGQVFYRMAVIELTEAGVDAAATLSSLLRKGLVEPTDSDIAGQQAMRFTHVLVRDAAYEALTKATRSRLHKRFARWLDRTAAGRAVDDFVGGHLEAAYLARADLGPLDPEGEALGREAAERLLAAARLTADYEGSTLLLARAERLVVEEGPVRWDVVLDLVVGLRASYDQLPRAGKLARDVRMSAEAVGAGRWVTMADLLLALLRQNVSPEGATDPLEALAADALDRYAEPPDHDVLLLAHVALSSVANMRGDMDAMIDHVRAQSGHAAATGRGAVATRTEKAGPYPLLLGSAPVADALEQAQDRWRNEDSRIGKVLAAAASATCAALVGDQRLAEQMRAYVDSTSSDLRPSALASIDETSVEAAVALGEWETARGKLTSACTFYERSGASARLSTPAALLAMVLLHLGEVPAAREYLDLAVLAASEDDAVTQRFVLAAQAWLAALDGEPEVARQRLAQAVAGPVQMLLDRGNVHRVGAEVERVLGDGDAAARHLHTAVDLYRQKGATAAAAALERSAFDRPG